MGILCILDASYILFSCTVPLIQPSSKFHEVQGVLQLREPPLARRGGQIEQRREIQGGHLREEERRSQEAGSAAAWRHVGLPRSHLLDGVEVAADALDLRGDARSPKQVQGHELPRLRHAPQGVNLRST